MQIGEYCGEYGNQQFYYDGVDSDGNKIVYDDKTWDKYIEEELVDCNGVSHIAYSPYVSPYIQTYVIR